MRFAIVLAACLFLGGCHHGDPSRRPSPGSAPSNDGPRDEHDVVVITSASSPDRSLLHGVELSVEITNRELHTTLSVVEIEDSDARRALPELMRASRVVAVITSSSLGGAPWLHATGQVPVFHVSELAERDEGEFYQVRIDPVSEGSAAATFAATQGWTNAAVVGDGSDRALMLMGGFDRFFQTGLSGTGPTWIGYAAGTSNPAGVVARLQQGTFDVIYLAGNASDSASLLRSLREIGMATPVIGNSAWADSTFANDRAWDGCYYTALFSADDPRAREFVDQFVAAYDQIPDTAAAFGFEVGLLVASAVHAARSYDPGSIAAHVDDGVSADVPGALGIVVFRERRASFADGIPVYRVQNGVSELVQRVE